MFVSQRGAGDFNTIQAAIDYAKPGTIITIGPGLYHEKLFLEKDGITLKGTDPKHCHILYEDYGKKCHADGTDYGTFRTATLYVSGTEVLLENLSVINGAGPSLEKGQAIALYLDSLKVTVRNCHLSSYQDTVFLAPLPKTPRIPGSFKGPSEHRPYHRQHAYFDCCLIEGDIDFIFGSGIGFFEACTLRSRHQAPGQMGYVTAPSTDPNEPFGFVFKGCNFVAEPGVTDASVYLGRPWRPMGAATFIGCTFGPHIHEARFVAWPNEAMQTGRFSCD